MNIIKPEHCRKLFFFGKIGSITIIYIYVYVYLTVIAFYCFSSLEYAFIFLVYAPVVSE